MRSGSIAGQRRWWLYFAGGVYPAAICVTRRWSGVEQLQNYTRYKSGYVALPADKAQKTYPRAGRSTLQPGPY
jgi:hypothetical protein